MEEVPKTKFFTRWRVVKLIIPANPRAERYNPSLGKPGVLKEWKKGDSGSGVEEEESTGEVET